MQPLHKKSCYFFFVKLFRYFWKEQFDTFDNRCDVLRAAFCDSRNVLLRGCVILCVESLRGFLCVEKLRDVSHSLRLCDFIVKRLHYFFCEEVA